jgi:hypothetical protein
VRRRNGNGDGGEARERPGARVWVGGDGAWGVGRGGGIEASAVKPRYGHGGGCGTAMVAAATTTTRRLRSSDGRRDCVGRSGLGTRERRERKRSGVLGSG